MRAPQLGHNKAKRRGKQTPMPRHDLARLPDNLPTYKANAAEGRCAVAGYQGPDPCSNPRVNKRQAFKVVWPKPEKAKSRNDKRAYTWQPARRAMALPPGIDNGPGQPRSL
jgi:hypothetical protein